MGKDAKKQTTTGQGTPHGKGGGGHNDHGNVVSVQSLCLCDGCKKKSEKAGFCMEHFDWFKEGLITKEGRKPSDFDKKYFHYTARRAGKQVA